MRWLVAVFTILCTVSPAPAASPEPNPQVQEDVRTACAREAAAFLDTVRVVIDPTGSTSYGMAVVQGIDRQSRQSVTRMCVYNRTTRRVELGAGIDPAELGEAVGGGFVRFSGITGASGTPAILDGLLFRPTGSGPFPAVVLLHGCGGVQKRAFIWARRLAAWGYVVLLPDSLSPRGVTTNCKRPRSINQLTRALDALGAGVYIAGLSYVDPRRIGVIGFSQGGSTALRAVNPPLTTAFLKDTRAPLFAAAIAFYPYCRAAREVNTPLLILIGEADDWTPAQRCRDHTPYAGDSGVEVDLVVYPGAHHGFDRPGLDKKAYGHVIRFDPVASADAVHRVEQFFAKYLMR